MSAHDRVTSLLKEHKAVLIRTNKHSVWKLPDGRKITMARTPSDAREALNNLSTLKKLLGVNATNRGSPGERQQKRPKSTPDPPMKNRPSNELRLAGIVKASLNEKVSALLAEIRKRDA